MEFVKFNKSLFDLKVKSINRWDYSKILRVGFIAFG